MSFAPSAISVPRKPMFRCDNQCSEKTLSFWQLASVVIEEGEESYTTNLCQKCHNESRKPKGDKPLTNWQWREFAGQKSHGGRHWKMMGKEQYVRDMFCFLLLPRRRWTKEVQRAGRRRKASSNAGQWQLESPAGENLEQVKSCKGTFCPHRMMKQGFVALNSGDWEEYENTFRKEVKVTEWAFDRIMEAFEQVAKEEARKLSIVQEIMTRSTDYLRRIIAPRGGRETLRCHICARIVIVSRWKTTSGGSLGEKGETIVGALSVANNTTGSNQTGFWWCKQAKVLTRPRSSKRMQDLRAFAVI